MKKLFLLILIYLLANNLFSDEDLDSMQKELNRLHHFHKNYKDKSSEKLLNQKYLAYKKAYLNKFFKPKNLSNLYVDNVEYEESLNDIYDFESKDLFINKNMLNLSSFSNELKYKVYLKSRNSYYVDDLEIDNKIYFNEIKLAFHKKKNLVIKPIIRVLKNCYINVTAICDKHKIAHFSDSIFIKDYKLKKSIKIQFIVTDYFGNLEKRAVFINPNTLKYSIKK